MERQNACKIRVYRSTQYADRLRNYKIFAKGEEMGTVARNSELVFDVPSGALTLEGRIDWGRSKPLQLNAVAGQTLEVDVANRWGAILGLWAITFGFRSYLTLTPRSGAVQ